MHSRSFLARFTLGALAALVLAACSEDATNPGNPNEDLYAVAIFGQGQGSGQIVVQPGNHQCPIVAGEASDSCGLSFEAGTVVTLTATPAAGSAFAGWGDDCASTTPTCTRTISGPLSVVAAFRMTVASVRATPAFLDLPFGGTAQVAAEALDIHGAVLHDRTIAWSSANSGIVSVTPAGLVTAHSDGSTELTASVEGKSVTVPVNVQAQPVVEVRITPDSIELIAGSTRTLTARTYAAGGGELPGRVKVWASTNNLVATVDQQGVVTATGPGTATITVASEGVFGSAKVVVQSSTSWVLVTAQPVVLDTGSYMHQDGFLRRVRTTATGGTMTLDLPAGSYQQQISWEVHEAVDLNGNLIWGKVGQGIYQDRGTAVYQWPGDGVHFTSTLYQNHSFQGSYSAQGLLVQVQVNSDVYEASLVFQQAAQAR